MHFASTVETLRMAVKTQQVDGASVEDVEDTVA